MYLLWHEGKKKKEDENVSIVTVVNTDSEDDLIIKGLIKEYTLK